MVRILAAVALLLVAACTTPKVPRSLAGADQWERPNPQPVKSQKTGSVQCGPYSNPGPSKGLRFTIEATLHNSLGTPWTIDPGDFTMGMDVSDTRQMLLQVSVLDGELGQLAVGLPVITYACITIVDTPSGRRVTAILDKVTPILQPGEQIAAGDLPQVVTKRVRLKDIRVGEDWHKLSFDQQDGDRDPAWLKFRVTEESDQVRVPAPVTPSP